MQNHLRKSEDLMLQNATPLRKSAPGPTLEMLQNPHVLLTFGRGQNPLRLPHKTTLQRPKVVHFDLDMCFAPQRRTLFEHHNCQSALNVVCFADFDFEMCFAPQWRDFFNISTSKSARNVVRFGHFDFEVCFAPQRHALFEHRNFQRCPECGAFCTF